MVSEKGIWIGIGQSSSLNSQVLGVLYGIKSMSMQTSAQSALAEWMILASTACLGNWEASFRSVHGLTMYPLVQQSIPRQCLFPCNFCMHMNNAYSMAGCILLVNKSGIALFGCSQEWTRMDVFFKGPNSCFDTYPFVGSA